MTGLAGANIPATEPAEYVVETGIHGAMRINRRSFPGTDAGWADALAKARRWSESNSTGHYWATVSFRDEGERNLQMLCTFNLKGR